MSDAPLPPQTDYPYAARMRVGGAEADQRLSPPPPILARLAGHLDIWLDWQPNDFDGGDGRDIISMPALLVSLGAFVVVNFLPFVALELIEQAPEWLGILVLAPQFGIMAGEFVFFAIVLVWWRGGIVARLLVHWLFALALYCLWTLGFTLYCSLRHRSSQSILDDAWMVLAGIPVVCLAIQAPLWCLRIYGGWRLEDRTGEPVTTSTAQLSIRDVLVGTAVVAVSLAMLRVMFDTPAAFGPGFWIRWAIGCLALSLVSVLTVAPLMRLILVLHDWRLAALGSFGYWLCIAALGFAVIWYLNPTGGWRSPTLAFVLMTLTGFATVSLPLWLVRATGNRLRVGRT